MLQSLALASLVALAATPRADNLGLSPTVLEPAYELMTTTRIRRDQLDAARGFTDVLDLALARLRHGPGTSACDLPRDPGELRALVDAVTLRALLLAQDGKDPGPLVIDILSAGRQLGRCKGGLLTLKGAMMVEARAHVLAEWSAHWGLLPESSRQAIVTAFARDPFTPSDLDQALRHEERDALAQLLPPLGYERLYSRRDTEALVARTFDAIRKEVAKSQPDVTELEQQIDSLITEDEWAFVRKNGSVTNEPVTPERIAELEKTKFRPNVLGRALVKILLSGTGRHASVMAEDLKAYRPLMLAGRSPVPSQDWIEEAGQPAVDAQR